MQMNLLGDEFLVFTDATKAAFQSYTAARTETTG